MVLRVEIQPELIAWAIDRSRIDIAELDRKFPKVDDWMSGELAPTFKQLEAFARSTHTSVGFFFLDEVPTEQLPIPDYRTIADAGLRRPSPDLLDTLYQCQQRQDWYRSYALLNQQGPVEFVASLTTSATSIEGAVAMRDLLGFEPGARGSSFGEAFRLLSEEAEEANVLVMLNGVVGSNSHRKLDPEEFRGFALVDSTAPLVFVNGADTKGAQIFTLAHELAHLWLGETGLSNAEPTPGSAGHEIETWCDQVAAEFLVPLAALTAEFRPTQDLVDELDRLARHFKVSTLVVLRRIHEAGFLSWPSYREAYEREFERVMSFVTQTAGGGGNFYNTQATRVSKRFARSVITSTLEGQTLYTEAFAMLGFKKLSTFNGLASRLGVVA